MTTTELELMLVDLADLLSADQYRLLPEDEAVTA